MTKPISPSYTYSLQRQPCLTLNRSDSAALSWPHFKLFSLYFLVGSSLCSCLLLRA